MADGVIPSSRDKFVEFIPVARVDRPKPARPAPAASGQAKNDHERQLEIANRNLEQLLAGGVKLMTDVLALARPEVFQKATKVQRWARRLSDNLHIEKAWELDLASLLYPLGVIALPDELATKYAQNQPLTPEESLAIEESSLIASRLIANIPRMQGVARTVFYAHKGYNGSGWPKDGPSGAELPQASRVLKILIDLADEATGLMRTRAGAFKTLAAKIDCYDPEIFGVAHEVLKTPATQPREITIEVELRETQRGDVLVHDLIDDDGRLLLSAGTELNELGIQRMLATTPNSRKREVVMVRRLTDDPVARSVDLPDTELF